MQNNTRTITKVCPKCNEGYMIANGEGYYKSMPVMFVHQCNKCEFRTLYEEIYPYLVMSVESRVSKESQDFESAYLRIERLAQDYAKVKLFTAKELYGFIIFDFYELWKAETKEEILDHIGKRIAKVMDKPGFEEITDTEPPYVIKQYVMKAVRMTGYAWEFDAYDVSDAAYKFKNK